MADRARTPRATVSRGTSGSGSPFAPARRATGGAAAFAPTTGVGTFAPSVEIASEADLLQFHRYAGNRAVVDLVQRQLRLQRVPITQATVGETLYNQTAASGASVPAGEAAGHYYGGQPVTYDMTRGEGGVTVTVRIKFIGQDRDTNRTLADGTANPTYLQPTGPRTAIPESDERHAFGVRVCQQAPAAWNNRVRFRGHGYPEGRPDAGVGGGVDVVLPVTFRATPVWDINSTAFDKEVRLFGSAVTPGQAAGHPIDAGNYYMNLGTYGSNMDVALREQMIYAHEYGHLLGIPDEYSQSNFQMHALLHQVAPSEGPARSAALDRATVERMVLAALTRQLFFRVQAAGAELGRLFMASRAPLERALADGVRGAAGDASVTDAITAHLEAQADPRLHRRIAEVVRFETGQNLGNWGVARAATTAEFAAGALGTFIGNQYINALLAPHGETVDVGGGASGRMSITIQGGPGGSAAGVWGAGESAALSGSATGVAERVVGETATGRIPPVRPSGTLLSGIRAIPGTWSGSAAGLAASVTPARIAAAIAEAVRQAGAAAAAAPAAPAPAAAGAAPAAAPRPSIRTVRQLYARALGVVQNAARSAARSELRAFVSSEIQPVLTASVATLRVDIAADVNRAMTTPADALAADAPPDPDLRAMVGGMKTRLEAATPAGANPADPNAAAANPLRPTTATPAPTTPNQEVTYSNEGMMSDNTGDVRADQLRDMVQQFNDRVAHPDLRHESEDSFRVERVS